LDDVSFAFADTRARLSFLEESPLRFQTEIAELKESYARGCYRRIEQDKEWQRMSDELQAFKDREVAKDERIAGLEDEVAWIRGNNGVDTQRIDALEEREANYRKRMEELERCEISFRQRMESVEDMLANMSSKLCRCKEVCVVLLLYYILLLIPFQSPRAVSVPIVESPFELEYASDSEYLTPPLAHENRFLLRPVGDLEVIEESHKELSPQGSLSERGSLDDLDMQEVAESAAASVLEETPVLVGLQRCIRSKGPIRQRPHPYRRSPGIEPSGYNGERPGVGFRPAFTDDYGNRWMASGRWVDVTASGWSQVYRPVPAGSCSEDGGVVPSNSGSSAGVVSASVGSDELASCQCRGGWPCQCTGRWPCSCPGGGL